MSKESNKKFAVIKTGGKQYKVKEGDTLEVEKLETKEGDKISFSEVLLKNEDGKVELGTPFVKGSKVEAKVLGFGREDKKIVFKYHSKTRYKKKKGHKQPYTKLEIISIK